MLSWVGDAYGIAVHAMLDNEGVANGVVYVLLHAAVQRHWSHQGLWQRVATLRVLGSHVATWPRRAPRAVA